jgi:hypothetical protein
MPSLILVNYSIVFKTADWLETLAKYICTYKKLFSTYVIVKMDSICQLVTQLVQLMC